LRFIFVGAGKDFGDNGSRNNQFGTKRFQELQLIYVTQ